MKKLMTLLLAGLTLISVCGCGSSGKPDEPDDPPVADETLVVINDLEFHLNKETSFSGLCYTAVEDFKEVQHDEHIPYVQYSYAQQDGSNLLFFRVFYYKNRDVAYALKDLGIEGNVELTDGNNGSLDYQLYAQPRDDGGTIHFYFITRDKDTYALNFISKYDIRAFEEKTVSSVHFAAE
ncbi:MAG: hypothetical protein IJM79_03135 [Erysipelotrichaceae bacterium]|nr:hypothetical protein [Erysipelotrichaceae bacterium]